MPTEKRTKSLTPESVPDIGNPDRKRVLNVLAQRRYRQRRREKIAELEARTKSITPPAQPHDGGVQIDQNIPSTPNPAPIYESVQDCVAEEVIRDMADVDFPVMDFNQGSLDFTLFSDFDQSMQSISDPPPAAFNFPLTSDGAQLHIPMLSTIQTFGTIATYLDIMAHVYDPFYLHVLPSTVHPSLPPNLHPTSAQTKIPHHPALDILPWPSVRDKLICLFSLPSAFRPPIAQEEEGDGQAKGVVQMVQDLDDSTDGVRVHGNLTGWNDSNELIEEAWEIGEVFYRKWWFCLDSKIVDISNRRRKERGMRPLKLTA